MLTDAEKAAQNGAPVIPQDEAAAANDELPPERIGEVPADSPLDRALGRDTTTDVTDVREPGRTDGEPLGASAGTGAITPARSAEGLRAPADVPPYDQDRAEAAVRELLLAVGEDPDREGCARRRPAWRARTARSSRACARRPQTS